GLDVEGYLEAVDRCRSMFPALRILSGIELGQPHRFPSEAAALLRALPAGLVLGSVHRVPMGDRLVDLDGEVVEAMGAREAVRVYFAEMLGLLEHSATFAILAHIDYVKGDWPHAAMAYEETDFEEEYRAVLKAAATNGLALEINTDHNGTFDYGPFPRPVVVRWWHEAGGEAVTFASDAHEPDGIGKEFEIAAGIAEAAGFRPAAHDFGFRLGLGSRARF